MILLWKLVNVIHEVPLPEVHKLANQKDEGVSNKLEAGRILSIKFFQCK